MSPLVPDEKRPEGFVGEEIIKDEEMRETLNTIHKNGILIVTPCRLKQIVTMMEAALPPEIAGMVCEIVGITPLHIDVALEHSCGKDEKGEGA